MFRLRCDLDFKCCNPIFSQDALAYDSLSSDQVWLPKNQQFRRCSSQSPILIIRALAVTLTLKTASSFCSVWHSGSFSCITIPGLVTKGFAVQRMSSRQIFTDIFNLCCDPDLKCSTPIFPQYTLAYDAVLWNQVWLQTDQQFKGIVGIVIIWYISPHCNLDIDDSE